MNGKKSVIIIGAGVGGIATAVYLARKGYSVSVYEKNGAPGGRCGQIIRDGHRFDVGATIYLMPSIYKEVFESLGLTIEESFIAKPLPVIYKLYFANGDVLNMTTDKSSMREQLEAIETGSFQQSQAYISKGYSLFQVAYKDLLARNFYSLFEFINFRNIGLLIKIKTYLRHYTYVGRFFNHPHLKIAYSFQNIYVGQNPLTAPALFSMLPAAELTEGTLFPIGGMYSIVEKLVSVAESLGVVFHYNQPVEKMVVNKHSAEGIVLEDGTDVRADILVANADLPYVYRELLPDRRRSARLERMHYSCSAMVFHWALDKVYPQLSHHSVFMAGQFKESLDMVFKKQSMSANPSFYVHAPVGSDPSAAPKSQDSISIIIPVGHLDPKKDQDWEALKQVARTSVIERLKKEKGMEDIEEHIKFEIACLPQAWESMYHVSKGSVFGSISHHILQMGYFRPHNRHKQYNNLYFVGGSTHPGNGVPLVLLSSKLTSERILRETNAVE